MASLNFSGYQYQILQKNSKLVNWMWVKDSCVKCKGKLKNTFQDQMAGKPDCRFHPNQGERKVKIKLDTCRKVLGKVDSVPVLAIG